MVRDSKKNLIQRCFKDAAPRPRAARARPPLAASRATAGGVARRARPVVAPAIGTRWPPRGGAGRQRRMRLPVGVALRADARHAPATAARTRRWRPGVHALDHLCRRDRRHDRLAPARPPPLVTARSLSHNALGACTCTPSRPLPRPARGCTRAHRACPEERPVPPVRPSFLPSPPPVRPLTHFPTSHAAPLSPPLHPCAILAPTLPRVPQPFRRPCSQRKTRSEEDALRRRRAQSWSHCAGTWGTGGARGGGRSRCIRTRGCTGASASRPAR